VKGIIFPPCHQFKHGKSKSSYIGVAGFETNAFSLTIKEGPGTLSGSPPAKGENSTSVYSYNPLVKKLVSAELSFQPTSTEFRIIDEAG